MYIFIYQFIDLFIYIIYDLINQYQVLQFAVIYLSLAFRVKYDMIFILWDSSAGSFQTRALV